MDANDKIEIIGEPVRLTLKDGRTVEQTLARVTTRTPNGGTLGYTVGRERTVFGVAYRWTPDGEWVLRWCLGSRKRAEAHIASGRYAPVAA